MGDLAGAFALQQEVVTALRARQASSTPPSSITRTVAIHYKRDAGDYAGWNLWVWYPDADEGRSVAFEPTQEDVVAMVEVPIDLPRLGFIVRRGEWAEKDIEHDRFLDLPPGGAVEAWIYKSIPEIHAPLSLAHAERNLKQYQGSKSETGTEDAPEPKRDP
jgi:hypothetical protein